MTDHPVKGQSMPRTLMSTNPRWSRRQTTLRVDPAPVSWAIAKQANSPERPLYKHVALIGAFLTALSSSIRSRKVTFDQMKFLGDPTLGL
jgi:hypothetical protein